MHASATHRHLIDPALDARIARGIDKPLSNPGVEPGGDATGGTPRQRSFRIAFHIKSVRSTASLASAFSPSHNSRHIVPLFPPVRLSICDSFQLNGRLGLVIHGAAAKHHSRNGIE